MCSMCVDAISFCRVFHLRAHCLQDVSVQHFRPRGMCIWVECLRDLRQHDFRSLHYQIREFRLRDVSAQHVRVRICLSEGFLSALGHCLQDRCLLEPRL